MRIAHLIACTALLSAPALFGRQAATPTTRPASPPRQQPAGPISIPQVQGPLVNAPGPGTIMGYVYWDSGAIQHTPANDCSGLSVAVSGGGASLGTFSSGHFAHITNVGTLSVCAYAIDQMPVGKNLEVQVSATTPAAFAPSMLATGGAASINIMTGKTEFNKCNLPPAVPSAADLSRSWWTCPNYAYNVNFILVPARGLTGANRMAVGKVPPGATPRAATPAAQGALLAPGGQKTLLGSQANPSAVDGGKSGMPVVQRSLGPNPSNTTGKLGDGNRSSSPAGSSSGDGGKKADELSPQPYPPKGASNASGDGGKAGVPAVQRSATVDGGFSGGVRQGSGGTLGPGQTLSARGNAGSGTSGGGTGRQLLNSGGGGSQPSALGGTPKSITNSDVIKMVQAGLPNSAIIASIRSRPGDFDPNKSRAHLFAAGGNDHVREMTEIWDAMIAKATNGRGGNAANELSPQPYLPKGAPAAAGSQASPQQVKATLAAAMRGKVVPIPGRPPAAAANAAIIAVLQTQRQAAQTLIGAHATTPMRLQSQGGTVGAGQAQQTRTNGGRTAASAGRSTMLNSGPAGMVGPSQTLGAPAPQSPGSRVSSAALGNVTSGTALTCTYDSTFRILSVTGNSFSGTFTPADPYNLYIIKGCSFGTQAPTSDQAPTDWIHLHGAGTFDGKFLIKFWSDNEIDAALDPALAGSPDLANLSLVIKRADGQAAQKGGFQFSAAGPQGSGGNSGGGSAQPGNRFSSAVQRSPVAGTALACTQDRTFRILSVSGSSSPATFTPTDQYNLYAITGCSFGSQAPTTDQAPTDWVHLYGSGSFFGKFSIEFWNDNEIDVSLDSSISGFPDLDNLTLDIKRADGQETRKGGFKFYAARETVSLAAPQSWAKLAELRSDDGTTMATDFSRGCGFCWTAHEGNPKEGIDQNQSNDLYANSSSPVLKSGIFVSRFYDGKKFKPSGQYDYFDFSRLAPGWTITDPSDARHQAQLFTFDQACIWVVTYREAFGTWSAAWDGTGIRVGLSDMSCSGWNAGDIIGDYQDRTGSYYALQVWVTGPRGTDPVTDKPTQ
jgi:hypothetical protein